MMNIRRESSLQTIRDAEQEEATMLIEKDQINGSLGGNFTFDMDKGTREYNTTDKQLK